MSMIRAIGKQPGHPPYEIHLSNDLRSLQTFVGGHIETVTVASDLVVICNEAGRLWGLQPNCSIAGVDFCGPVLLVGYKDDVFCDVPLKAEDSPWSMWIQEVQHDQP